jgi:hypothetical protein
VRAACAFSVNLFRSITFYLVAPGQVVQSPFAFYKPLFGAGTHEPLSPLTLPR